MSRTHRATESGAEPGAKPGYRPAPQWNPIGSQVEGIEAIRAVWERAADHERRRPRPGRARRREPARLAPALLGILVCACLLMFFAWVAAPALWLSIGHGHTGTVTVTACSEGFAPACDGQFSAEGWTEDLRLTGDVTAADVGAELTARSTGPGASSAYVGGDAGLILRWAPALAMFVACGLLLTVASGATRLEQRRGTAIGLCWIACGAVWATAMAIAF